MIKLVDTKSDHVLGVRVEKALTARDIETAMGFLTNKVRTRDQIALYVEVDEMSGMESAAIATELRQSIAQIKSLSHIKRAAVVTGNGTPREGFGLEDLVPMIEVRRFSTAEREAARTWAAEIFD